ncbi:MAG: carboxylating nicotinate-nucleotide diphosphorylase [Verrucomicrobia bacterium]|nr:carboxylating nicotinate-nucleotide diphosphorylase [Verrucomicrobiota bacterium]MBU4429376.1 carboxylating nicotinate-nucleotide diphosphorylase [Verrucomicrobiota bacterium]
MKLFPEERNTRLTADATHPHPSVIPPSPDCRALVRKALREDMGSGDITSNALVSPRRQAGAVILARGHYVVSGVDVARTVFRELDPRLRFTAAVPDGQFVEPDQPIARLEGRARSILAGERTALNFLQRMTGIASLTAHFVEKVKPHPVIILDTRKTTPLLRTLEKYAVLCGGGANHRMGLYDRVLIKDNHRRLWSAEHRGDLGAAVATAQRQYPGILIEVEVETESELAQVLDAAPDWILLDNMPPDRLRRCVALAAGRCQIEASGGITLDNAAEIAATGVQAISLGCLSHSAPAADLSLDLEENLF